MYKPLKNSGTESQELGEDANVEADLSVVCRLQNPSWFVNLIYNCFETK